MLYDVVLTGFDADEIMIIDLCMTMCDVDASTAYQMVDNMPSLLAHSVGMKAAKKVKKAFEYEGAYIEIREADDNSIEGIFKGLDAPGVEKEDEGINLEKVFEDNSNINMKPNDYGDYALDNFEEKKDDKIDDVFNDSRYQNANFFETVANQEEDLEEGFEFENDKPAYENLKNNKNKQYITKQDLKDIDNNVGVNASPYVSLMDEMEEEHNSKVRGRKKKKKYITREIADDEESLSQLREELFDTGYNDEKVGSQQEIIANNEFMNLGGNAYNEDCMQINTQKSTDNDMDSSIDNMKKLYDKKANRGNSKGKSLDEDWANIIKKHNSNNEPIKNTNDFRKEQVVCPKCGSTFVSAKKSQGFFGTKKVKYVCEACRFKF